MAKYKLVCFDVDGTLIDNVKFSWQIFHDYFQTDEHRREDARNNFFNGKITYKQWAEHDINLWREKNAKRPASPAPARKNPLRNGNCVILFM